MRVITRFLAGPLLACAVAAPAWAEVSEVRVTRQPGLIYMPVVIMEQNKLLEQHAAKAGLGDLKVSWLTFTSGGASIDALISGNVDLVTGGVTNLLVVWDRTKGDVKGLSGVAAVPSLLVTRNPDVKGLADFSDKDRIAVPTIKISTQAVVLQMAAEQAFGEAGRHKLDPITVQIGHPDAVSAVLNPNHEINSHFSLPPYQELELKDPRVHVVLNAADVVGGPLSNAVVYGTRKFHDANPKIVAAFLAALDEANKLIDQDPRKAAEIYLAATREKLSVEELAAIIKTPGSVYSATPHGTMKVADHFFKTGVLKIRPQSWKDFFFADVHGLPGS